MILNADGSGRYPNPEVFKAVMELAKQLITLSTAAIVLTASLIDKAHSTMPAKWLMKAGLTGFALCIVVSLLFWLVVSLDYAHHTKHPNGAMIALSEDAGLRQVVLLLLACVPFLIGVGCLTAFAFITV